MKLLSTIVAPSFRDGCLDIIEITEEQFRRIAGYIKENFHGHEPTVKHLEAIAKMKLPPAERKFWDGSGWCVAARPIGGVRGGEDVENVEYEFALFRWVSNTLDQQQFEAAAIIFDLGIAPERPYTTDEYIDKAMRECGGPRHQGHICDFDSSGACGFCGKGY